MEDHLKTGIAKKNVIYGLGWSGLKNILSWSQKDPSASTKYFSIWTSQPVMGFFVKINKWLSIW